MSENGDLTPSREATAHQGEVEVIDLDGMFQSDSKTDAEKDSDLSALLDIMAN